MTLAATRADPWYVVTVRRGPNPFPKFVGGLSRIVARVATKWVAAAGGRGPEVPER